MKKLIFLLLAFAALTTHAQVKVSDLPAAGSMTGAELVPVVQSGVTKKATTQNIASLAIDTATKLASIKRLGDSTAVLRTLISAGGTDTTGFGLATRKMLVDTAAALRSAIGTGGGGSGSVTSVAIAVPSGLSVSGSPITTSGTITISAPGNASTQYLTGAGTAALVANLPVSTATQTAIDLKANIASPTFTGTVGGITKSMVGLSSVDNTSDASKPVSTATQTALDAKAALSHTHAASDITSGILPVVRGGTGTATPGIVAGTNVTVTGTWPNQTVSATGGGGGGVPTTRTITINGNTQDLSADRSFNVSTPKGTLNVEDFGAVALDPAHPDRGVDNRIPLQHAIDSCIRMGGCNLFLPALYAYDSTLVIPLTPSTSTNYPVIKFVAGRRAAFEYQGLSSDPPSFYGSGFYCRMVDTTNLHPFAITYEPSPFAGIFTQWNYTSVDLGDFYLLIKTKDSNGVNVRNNVGGADLSLITQVWGSTVRITTTSPGTETHRPTSSIGIKFPIALNHAITDIGTIFITGFDTGAISSEHGNFKHVAVAVNRVGWHVGLSTYPTSIQHFTAEDNWMDLETESGGAVNIGVWESEGYTGSPSRWYDHVYSIHTMGIVASSINIGTMWPLQTGGFYLPPTYVQDVPNTLNLNVTGGVYGVNQVGLNYWTNYTRPTWDKLLRNGVWGFNTTSKQLERWDDATGWLAMSNPVTIEPKSVTQTFTRQYPWTFYGNTSIVGGALSVNGSGGNAGAYVAGLFNVGETIDVEVFNTAITSGTVFLFLGNSSGADYSHVLSAGYNIVTVNTTGFTGNTTQIGVASGANVGTLTSITVTRH